MRSVKVIAGLLLASCLVAPPAGAASLLGGLVTTGDGGLSVNAGNLATASVGTSNGLDANASVGGSSGVDANASLGGSSSVANVNASAGGSGGLNTNATVGGSSNVANVNASLGGGSGLNTTATVGGGSLANVNTSLGGSNGLNATATLGGGSLANVGLSLGGSGTGTGGTGTGPGGTGTGIGGGGAGLGGGTGGGLIVRDPNGNYVYASGNRLSVTALAALACTNRNSPQAIAQLLKHHRYGSSTLGAWRHAANVQLVPIKLCPQLRANVRAAASADRNVALVQNLAASDPLISASLSRGRYHAGNVLAVDQTNGLLTVYVY
ncbi:MAG TPA: hypothetical protein VHB74_01425 [Devosia sp.]|nr:hypothetical protein [Devosia sp.]